VMFEVVCFSIQSEELSKSVSKISVVGVEGQRYNDTSADE